RFRGVHLEDEDSPIRTKPELLDPSLRELLPMVLREEQVEVSPLAIPKGNANSAGRRVEMESVVVGVEERLAAVWDRALTALPEPSTVALDEGEGRVGGGAGMSAKHPELPSDLLTEGDERAAGGEPFVEGFANASVDEETVILEEGKERRGKGSCEPTEEAPANGGHGGVEVGTTGRD
ncbi:MAG: hypothetical protein L3K13_03655, partial [Thermoplasmata archaeon]|nr:hypothetical protein [Thermoplasmata archaeon]